MTHRSQRLRVQPTAHWDAQGTDSLKAAIPLAASRIVSLVRKLLEDARGAHVLLMPVLLGGDVMQPLPQLLSYPNRSESPECWDSCSVCSVSHGAGRAVLMPYSLEIAVPLVPDHH